MKDWLWLQRSLASEDPQNLSTLDNISGADLWEALYIDEPIAVLLESPATVPSKLARYSIAAGKPRQIWTPAVGEILPCLEQLRSLMQTHSQFTDLPDHLPFTGGYLGWLGYDLAWEIERLPYTKPDNLPFPVAFWYEPTSFAILDHHSHQLWLAATKPEELVILNTKIDRLQKEKQLPITNYELRITNYELPITNHQSPITYSPIQQGYETIVKQAQKHIYEGDIFQANLSLRYGCAGDFDGWLLYKQLQNINPSPFASYWRTTWGEVISVSPERLVSLRDRHAETRPIAGTRPRGKNPEQDQQLEQELLACHKEQAEHIMLVDLERNDLGRVCEWGTVKVDELLTIERYSHVMHLVSNVVGTLRRDRNLVDLIRATFPGGTITGCPKVRCMEIVERLEPQRRSLFYGSCGYIDRRGNMDLNILIRTLLKTGDHIWGQVGAGIVADSVSDREWRESMQKAQAQLAALGLI
ncbi:anthranilate synthase component I [Pseudanabaena sp. FACHB-1277]|jgi:para-aminobenzoate synthetase component 1|uniref:Anthranilate synthase component 1 n=1 Tax=Pseudanabaena cinerea FACHB-1277 TaxID=2949581 RepID=A0A926UT25_9CYAN|nr:anthranilate synthase component I [Pseudanabaena cinerea]MBD2150774.1 anthranilate synthase component I [Pseudanabaena cinerea FACHB-1277]